MKKIKIEAAEFTSSDATPELIKELVADDSKRGEFMILDDGKDFVQIAGDDGNDGFTLEYGEDGVVQHCKRLISRAEAESVFLEYIDGLRSWQSRFEWENVEPTKAIFPFVAVLIVLAGLIATVLLLIFGEY